MIKGLAITPPTVGRISIGRMVEKNGKRLPEKDDQFTITTQIQGPDGWVLHPLDAQFREATTNSKLRSIPVRCLFNAPDLNLRAEYSCFDRASGRPLCVGDGDQCKRVSQDGVETLPCPSPDQCAFGKDGFCKPYGRLHVQVGDGDDLGSFVFRTTGFNSIRTLSARLSYYQAVSGGLLSCLPLELKLRGKSTTQSYRQPIYYVDLVLRDGVSLQEAIIEAQKLHQQRKEAGIDQTTLDAAARMGFANGKFECGEEEGAEVLEEFFPDTTVRSESIIPPPVHTASLKDKLEVKSNSLQ